MALDILLELGPEAQAAGPLPKGTAQGSGARPPGAIPVSAFAFSIQNTTTLGTATTGAGAGKAAFNALTITKGVDAGSAALFTASTSGAPLPEVMLSVRKGVGVTTGYLTFRFKTVLVTRIDWSASADDDQPKEEVELLFGALEVAFAPQAPNGQSQQPTVVSWNVMTNASV